MNIRINSNQAQQLLELIDNEIACLDQRAYECRRDEVKQAKVISQSEQLTDVRKQLTTKA